MKQATAVALILGTMLLMPARAWSQTPPPIACHTKAIKATGGLSILEGGARSKARAAWIRRVKDHRKLGVDYAAWLRAKDPSYACKKLEKRHQCEAVAIPCKV